MRDDITRRDGDEQRTANGGQRGEPAANPRPPKPDDSRTTGHASDTWGSEGSGGEVIERDSTEIRQSEH